MLLLSSPELFWDCTGECAALYTVSTISMDLIVTLIERRPGNHSSVGELQADITTGLIIQQHLSVDYNLLFLACFDLEWHVSGTLRFNGRAHESGPELSFMLWNYGTIMILSLTLNQDIHNGQMCNFVSAFVSNKIVT